MGTINHNAIVVTGYDAKLLETAHNKATELGMLVTPMSKSGVNGYRSFLVAPDGSKEWWPESDAGNERRDTFVKWLADGPVYLDWAEVSFGELGAKLVRSNRLEEAV